MFGRYAHEKSGDEPLFLFDILPGGVVTCLAACSIHNFAKRSEHELALEVGGLVADVQDRVDFDHVHRQ